MDTGLLNLRCYQTAAVDAINARFDAGDQRTLAVLPTGAGKTIVAAHVARRMLPKGRIIVVVHREELLRQAADKFGAITGVWPAIEKADERSDENNMHGPPAIVIASVQTLCRPHRLKRFCPNDFAFLWIDEAHHATAKSYVTCTDHFSSNPTCKILGVTATADRADGEKLGKVFQSVAFDYELPDIISDGYLVPIHQSTVVIEGLDFSKVRTTAGDLNAGDLEQVMMFEKPLHGVAYATIELACGLPEGTLLPLRDRDDRAAQLASVIERDKCRRRKTLVFATSVKHAERMAEIFNRWLPGSAAHVDGGMSQETRRRTLRSFKYDEIQFLCNCMIATEGFDEPGIEVVSVARPTKSRPLYAQMIGRGTRPAADIAEALGTLADAEARRNAIADSVKPHVTILDFAGNAGRHRLISVIDILGERYEPAVVEIAREMKVAEPAKALELAKEDLDRRRREAEEKKRKREAAEAKRRELDAGTRQQILANAGYLTHEVDGFDKYSAKVDRRFSQPAASEKQVKLLIAFGVAPETAKKYSIRQAGSVIQSYKSRNAKPDWSRLHRQPPAPLFGSTNADGMEPSNWQCDRLHKLGHTGQLPPTHASAKRLILELEARRRKGAA